MGGTLTSFIALDRDCVPGRGGYTDTLLGPERTDVLSRQDNDRTGLSVIPPDVVRAGAEVWVGFVCCLRTAQWTRASLLVSV